MKKNLHSYEAIKSIKKILLNDEKSIFTIDRQIAVKLFAKTHIFFF
jgi:hypothetical protein